MRASLRTLVIVLLAAAVFVLPTAAELLTDWWWFGELGQQDTYARILAAQGVLGGLALGLSAVWLALHLRLAARTLPVESQQISTPEGMTLAMPARREVQTLGTGLAVAAAVLLGLYGASSWQEVLAWRHAVPFGATDPVLGHEVAFYVFTLPVLELVRSFVLLLTVVALIGTAGIYLLAGQLALTPFGFRLADRARRHLGLLAALGFVVVAAGAWLSRAQTLLQPTGIIRGAGYTDVHARLPFAAAETVAALVAAVLVVAWALRGRGRYVAGAFVVYALTLVAGQLYAEGLQRFVVTPNEQAREAPYIQYNIDATRHAFALDTIVQRPLTGDAELTRADIEKNRATLDNVRLWDHQPLLETFGQIQEIRTYYDFTAVDNDRYEIDGQMRQVMLSARELNPEALPNRTWVNERLTFTHGHGLTLGPVNQVTSEGLPVLFIRDLPPVSTVNLPVTEPSLYFGELSNEYAVVRTRAREFHYPKGDANVFSTYEGRGGIVLDSLLKKLAFAARFRAYQLLLSDDITAESRLLFDRQIKRRAQKLAPFLQFDGDPYVVVHDGRLVWMLDGYTVTSRYPYATEGAPGVSYIRNAAKVVVDAYHGTTDVYLAEPGDPLARAYAAAFPTLFRPLDDMPAGLRAHVRYPEGIFGIQAAVYATYHMTSAAVFYNKEDQWEVPSIERGARGDTQARGLANEAMQPWYTIMKLPGERDAEFIQMLPFTPRNKDNLAAWMVARSDGQNYGQLVVFQFPKQKVVFGPRQVIARINQDQNISPQITLWSQQGSEVIQGTLLVIPIEESLLYIRPLYLRSEGGRIPELKRVIVAYQNRIVMEPSLDEAISRIFAPGSGEKKVAGETLSTAAALPAGATAAPTDMTTTPEVPPDTAEPQGAGATTPDAAAGETAGTTPADLGLLAARANAAYLRAIDAQRAGNWAKYGEEMKLVGELLDKMARERRPQ